MGVFKDGGEACSRYYPSHFTEYGGTSLPVSEGCKFGSEINIITIHDGEREVESNDRHR
jgi:hypothetical protein